MQIGTKRMIGLVFAAILWAGGLVVSAQEAEQLPPGLSHEAEAVTLGQSGQGASSWSAAYRETLEGTIGPGEEVSYTTISSEYADDPLVEGYYPGELTVELTGPVVIESGASLFIGTLAYEGPEASPVLSGTCTPEGLIVVKAGGRLRLTDVVLETSGEGLLIVQEPGASVELALTQVDPGLVQWSPPLVDNLNQDPQDLWLASGTPLTEDLLPRTMVVSLQEQGSEKDQEVTLAWDLDAYDGRTEGEWTLSGQFLDGEGQPLASFRPLELTVHWYVPEELVVSQAVWKGDTVPNVQMRVENLPEFADVWGEISTDQGKTWVRWDQEEQFFLVPHEDGSTVCVFVLPDKTPRLFRVMAHDPLEQRYWSSQAFALQPEESDDSGGNRGGSTTPSAPEREPEPADRPSGEETFQPQADVPAQAVLPTPQPQPESQPESNSPAPQADAPAPSPEDSAPEPQTQPSPQPEEEQTPQDSPAPDSQEEAPASQPEEAPSRSSQLLWVLAGVAGCVAVAAAAAKFLPFGKQQ